MTTDALSRFGKLLMREVRDASISEWDKTLRGEMKDADSRRLHAMKAQLGEDCAAFTEKLIPAIVDTVLHHLLWTLETSDSLTLQLHAGDITCENLAAASDGLAGEVYGDKGWRARFSQERIVDSGSQALPNVD